MNHGIVNYEALKYEIPNYGIADYGIDNHETANCGMRIMEPRIVIHESRNCKSQFTNIANYHL